MIEIPDTQSTKALDGSSLAYQIVGDGSRVIGYVPPMGSIELIWEEPSYAHFLHRLAALGRLGVIDPPRAQGAAERMRVGASYLDQAMDDVRTVFDAVGAGRVALIADGFIGPPAILFAASYPERVSALVLVNSFAWGLRDDEYPHGVREGVLAGVLDVVEQSWGQGLVAPVFAPSRVNDERFIAWHARMERLIQSPGAARAVIEWLYRLDVRSFLPNIQVPTLVLHREGNRVLRPGHGRYLADHIPGAKYVSLAGEDQFIYTGDSDALVDEIEEFLTGVRPVAEPDRVLATVLFTDIVSSTEHATRLGDKGWTRVLDEHDRIIARELERHRGRRVNPTGDGILATFDGPARAVRCAQAICSTVRALGIEIRAGLHTGEVELRGDDIGGIAVHIGQRVSALAGPGEVLVSRTVTDLVAGSGLEFEDRGERELKGVPSKWAIFAVKT